MHIERIWLDNPLRNFNYLIACAQTGEAAVLDPFEPERCLSVAEKNGWSIRQIFNTHEHYDHIAGNQEIKRATGATIAGPADARGRIPDMDRELAAGDQVRIGQTIVLECLNTPGHTLSHVSLFGRGETPVLFAGDTVFNAGVGNCRNGGDPDVLFSSIEEQIAPLPEDTVVYPGHDYILSNLRFTLDREPDNTRAKALLDSLSDHDPADAPRCTLGLEKQVNVFFRLDSPSVVAGVRDAFPDLPEKPDRKATFIHLRKLRDSW